MFATHIIQWRIVAQKIRLEKEEENVTFEEDRDGTILSADNNKVQNQDTSVTRSTEVPHDEILSPSGNFNKDKRSTYTFESLDDTNIENRVEPGKFSFKSSSVNEEDCFGQDHTYERDGTKSSYEPVYADYEEQQLTPSSELNEQKEPLRPKKNKAERTKSSLYGKDRTKLINNDEKENTSLLLDRPVNWQSQSVAM